MHINNDKTPLLTLIHNTVLVRTPLAKLMTKNTSVAALPVLIIGPYLTGRQRPEPGVISCLKNKLLIRIFDLILPPMDQDHEIDRLLAIQKRRKELSLATCWQTSTSNTGHNYQGGRA